MKKLLLFTAFLLFLSCQKSELFEQYQSVQKLWYLESTEFVPTVSKEVKFINFGFCNPSRKKVNSSGFGCSAPINQLEVSESVSLSFSISQNKIMRISSVIDFKNIKGDGLSPIKQSDTIIALEEELKGDWVYEVTENKMILTSNKKRIVFKQ
jgi:hypothetical protein